MKQTRLLLFFCSLQCVTAAQINYILYYQQWIKVEQLALSDQMEAAETLRP